MAGYGIACRLYRKAGVFSKRDCNSFFTCKIRFSVFKEQTDVFGFFFALVNVSFVSDDCEKSYKTHIAKTV